MRYKLPNDFGISIVSSEVGDGPMNPSIPENVKKFSKKIGLLTPLSQSEQIHSNKISKAVAGKIVEGADGLFTFDATPLSVRSADCVPIFLSEPKSGFVSAIHCGRKSLLSGIISKTLPKVLDDNSVDPTNLKVFIGPHIRAENYPLLEKDVKICMQSGFSVHLKEENGCECLDLTSAVISQLEKIGVQEDNIVDCKTNTYTDDRFFSSRRDKKEPPEVFITICTKNVIKK